MTNEELDRLEALATAATPGPWTWEGLNLRTPGGYRVLAINGFEAADDTAFIAASREAVPQLIARVRALEADLERWIESATDFLAAGATVEAERDALKKALREALDNWSDCREPNPYDKGARERIAELRRLLGDKP